MSSDRLPQSFFEQNARIVAQQLLGKVLVHSIEDEVLAGTIVETEAYCDFCLPDLACHGSRNKGRPTRRTEVMFGPAGFSYVYLNYGIHSLFNIVTGRDGIASAVLIRALEPVSGLKTMARQRVGRTPKEWTNGPGKLSQAMRIDQSANKQNLCEEKSVIWVEAAPNMPLDACSSGPRVGLGKTPEPWFSMPWRFWIKNNQYVSKR
ncbi:MAG: DNA-3-methyladenine glycosylase [Chloroflexota bacterium]